MKRLLVVFPDIDQMMVVSGNFDDAVVSLHSLECDRLDEIEYRNFKVERQVDGMQDCQFVQRVMAEIGIDHDERHTIVKLNI